MKERTTTKPPMRKARVDRVEGIPQRELTILANVSNRAQLAAYNKILGAVASLRILVLAVLVFATISSVASGGAVYLGIGLERRVTHLEQINAERGIQ